MTIPTGYSEKADRIEPLGKIVDALLCGRIRFASHALQNAVRRIRAVFVPMECWRCGAGGHYYYLDTSKDAHGGAQGADLTSCGRHVISEWGDGPFSSDVVAGITARVRDADSNSIRLGAIKERYSKTVGDRYLSFGCPECDAIYGRNFLSDDIAEFQNSGPPRDFPVIEFDLPPTGRVAEDPHWCYASEGRFCRSGTATR